MDMETIEKEGYFNTYTNDFKINLKNIHYAYKIFYDSLYNDDITFKKLCGIYQNNKGYCEYLLDVANIIKKRFEEVENTLKRLNITYLLVYTKEDREEMIKNGAKYDIILDTLIGRCGVLLELIRQNQFILKYNFIEKYISLICVQNDKNENVFFLYGTTEPDLIEIEIKKFLEI